MLAHLVAGWAEHCGDFSCKLAAGPSLAQAFGTGGVSPKLALPGSAEAGASELASSSTSQSRLSQ